MPLRISAVRVAPIKMPSSRNDQTEMIGEIISTVAMFDVVSVSVTASRQTAGTKIQTGVPSSIDICDPIQRARPDS